MATDCDLTDRNVRVTFSYERGVRRFRNRAAGRVYETRIIRVQSLNLASAERTHTWFCHWIAFLIAAILATNYTVNRFYTLGAAMWDSGWFAHLAATGLRNPPAIGGWFLSDHMSLVFAITALAHALTPAVPAPIFFAFTQGIWFGLLGLAASLCLRPLLPAVPTLMLSVLCAMNGISLSVISFRISRSQSLR